jgi:hypothetical protein
VTNKPNDTDTCADCANSQNTLFRTTPYQISLTAPASDKTQMTQKVGRPAGKVIVVKTITVSTVPVSTTQNSNPKQD